MHVRQCVQSLCLSTLNGFQWKLNVNALVKCHQQKRIIFGQFNKHCAILMKNINGVHIKCSESQALSHMFKKTILSTNVNFGILCATYVDVVNGIFPSNIGIKCLMLFKSSKISNVNRDEKRTKLIERKIKYKFMYDDADWNRNVEIKKKLELLSFQLTRLIITTQKIVIGRTWNGAWYVPKKKMIKEKEYMISFNGLHEPTKRKVTNHEMYVTYNLDKPLESMNNIIKTSDIPITQRQCDIPIGAVTFSNLFSENVGESLAKSLHSFMISPKEHLETYGKVEYNKNENRIKFWCGACIYYYNSQCDKKHLGNCFPLAMKVANGVRLNDGYQLPKIIEQIQAGLLESEIIEHPTDAIAVNLYHNDTQHDVSSGLGNHNEVDRFGTLTHCTFTSGHPSANTVLSINQSKLHGTAEVEIPSVHLEIVRFDS